VSPNEGEELEEGAGHLVPEDLFISWGNASQKRFRQKEKEQNEPIDQKEPPPRGEKRAYIRPLLVKELCASLRGDSELLQHVLRVFLLLLYGGDLGNQEFSLASQVSVDG